MRGASLLVSYIAIILVSILAVGLILQTESHSNISSGITAPVITAPNAAQQSSSFLDGENYFHDPKHPFILLLLQLIVIFVVSQVFGWLAGKLGQHVVIGEIIGGIFLGPSVMGHLVPAFSDFMFPSYSMTSLYIISQVGLMFFMFIIGLELDWGTLRSNTRSAVFISHTTIALTFCLGAFLSFFIYPEFVSKGSSFLPFALFMGIALSITAFPVLARALQERNLLKTPLGSFTLTIASIDDATAWCLLAMVLALTTSHDVTTGLITIGLAAAYVVIMFVVVRPLLNRVIKKRFESEDTRGAAVRLGFILLIVSSFITRFIGIHILFGAFVAGIIIHRDEQYRTFLAEKLKDVALIIFMPVFFVLSGLRTNIELLGSGQLLLLTLIVILLAMAGKIGGGTIFSRLSGQSWKDSFFIGAMLNTRGLMELIVLNIGYDLGVFGSELYTIMVIMALVTTFSNSPLLALHKKLFGSTTPP